MTGTASADAICIEKLSLHATCGRDAWSQPREQALELSARIHHAVAAAGDSDQLVYSLHYGLMAKGLRALVEQRDGGWVHETELLAACASHLAHEHRGRDGCLLELRKPKAILQAASGYIVRGEFGPMAEAPASIVEEVEDLEVFTILGVNPCEREERQKVVCRVCVKRPFYAEGFDFVTMVKDVQRRLEDSTFFTIERLVTHVADVVGMYKHVEEVVVRASKPSALPFAKYSAVEIRRAQYVLEAKRQMLQSSSSHLVYLALGSNIGNRTYWIEQALQKLKAAGVDVVDTAGLYESEPMYLHDQARFLNTCAKAYTTLSPEALLRTTQAIENELGRVKTVVNGPRNIDIDILLYDSDLYKSDDLQIPHPRLLEREFVLRPLCDIGPNYVHPLTSATIKSHFDALEHTLGRQQQQVFPVIPTRHTTLSTREPLIMGIVNMTPDSFSDGGVNTMDNVLLTVRRMVDDGAHIIDIGGYSTRPNCADVDEEQEMARIIPVIRRLRQEGLRVPISVDTFRASVARVAIEAGADILNDVSAGAWDADMLSCAAELNVPICLMHTRGNPSTMNSLAQYDDVVDSVKVELGERLASALAAGIPRRNIILDPGLGFAKQTQHNLAIIKRLPELIHANSMTGYVWLLGPSRKRFTGQVTHESQPSDRVWGTAGAVYACLQGGAHIIRVHDVKEMALLAKMQSAIASA